MPTQEEIEAMRKAVEPANQANQEEAKLLLEKLERAKEEVRFQMASQRYRNRAILRVLSDALNIVKDNKPGDRSELDRSYAVLITDLEKAVAYAKVYIAGE